MNTPAGFVIKNGQITDINPLQAIFNPSTPYETVHMILACYVATGFAVAAVYAFYYLRGKRTEYVRKGVLLGMLMALVATPLQIISGDFNARFLANYQPVKFAAMEGVIKTQTGVRLRLVGWSILTRARLSMLLKFQMALVFWHMTTLMQLSRGWIRCRVLLAEHSNSTPLL